MKVSICDFASFWMFPSKFFKEEHQDIHLTFVEGHQSTDINLEELTLEGFQYLVGSVQSGLIETDMEYSELVKALSKAINPKEEVPEETTPLTPEQKELQEKFLSSQARRHARAENLEKRCENLANSSYKALRAGLAGEENQWIISKVLDFEKKGKRRKTVLKFLKEKLVSVRKQKIRNANKELLTNADLFGVGDKPEKVRYNDPVEEDIQLIDFDVSEIEILREDDDTQPSKDQVVDGDQ